MDPCETNGRIDVPELWRVLQELEEGTLEEPRCDELAALLGRSPSARRAYLEYFQQSAVLRMEAAKLYERGLLPYVESGAQSRRVFQRSVMAAAALVALAAVIAALFAVSRSNPTPFSAVAAANTRWSIDGESHASGDEPVHLEEGCTLRVSSGTLKLETDEGDLLVLQGPATVSFPKLHRPQVHGGWLWIDTAKSGKPFEVKAGTLRIHDIGTRFGVRVPEDEPTEIHLVKGKVEVMAEKTGKRLFESREAGKAFSLTAIGGREQIPMAIDPFPELPELLARTASYRTTVYGQAPSGYWPLDGAENERLANEVPGGSSAASLDQAVRSGEPGMAEENGFRGLPKDNRSLYLTGDLDKSVVFGLDGKHGVRTKEGAVAFWIRREPGPLPKGEILWLAGYSDTSSGITLEAAIQTRLDTSGRVLLEMRNGSASLDFSSPHSINDGLWHHVAASWSPSSAALFVDGAPVARGTRLSVDEDIICHGRHVRFGKPSWEQRERFDPFTGWVDEIALWDRPLSLMEIRWQFDSAVGAAED
jgi:ferric-dicitrate binding protein FerR (iron transport regulator)